MSQPQSGAKPQRFELVLSGGELENDEPLDHLLDLAVRLDVRYVDLWFPKNFADGVDAVATKLARRSLHVACVSSPTEMVRDESTENDREMLLAAIDVARRLGAGYANTYFGFRSQRDDERSIELYASNVAPCVRAAEASGVVITLENEFDGFGHDPAGSDPTRRIEATRRLVERINSPFFRLTFDPCNAYFAGLEPFPSWWDALARHTAYVHIKDGHRLEAGRTGSDGWVQFRDEGRAYTTCEIGDGALNWPGLLARLVKDGYRGFFTLEPHATRERRDAAWGQAVGAVRRLLQETNS